VFSYGTTRFNLATQALLTLLCGLMLVPLAYTVDTSLQRGGLGNYKTVLTNPNFPRFFLNSLLVTASATVLVVAVSLPAAYGVSRLKLPGGQIMYVAMLLGLMVPTSALIVPLLVEVKRWGLLNDYLALVIPYAALLTPFTMLLCRSFIDHLPNELFEASLIDGCSRRETLMHLVVPLSGPIVAVCSIWSVLFCWNEFFLANLFMQSPSMQTITQAPSYYVGVYTVDIPKVFTSLVLISVPVVLFYLSLQRSFLRAVTAGASK